MFPSEKTSQGEAGDGEEGHQVAGEDHEPGPPGVVGEEDSHTGHQVEVTN